MSLLEQETIRKSSTPIPLLQIPHLPDPGREWDTPQKVNPDFSVRLGTSLARCENTSPRRYLTSSSRRSSISDITGSSDTLDNGNKVKNGKGNGSGSKQLRALSRGLGRVQRKRREAASRLLTLGETTTSYISETEPALERFRRIGRIVKLISGVCVWLKRYIKKPEVNTWSFMEMYLNVQNDLNQVLTFNPMSFAKVEPTRMKLMKYLSVPKDQRTSEDVKNIMSCLRDNAAFQDYPLSTKQQLAKCMQYQCYETRRVILRQGHRPMGFYILLSGTAIVNIRDTDPRTGKHFVRTVHQLSAGATFGEIALVEGGVRTASIICKTPCELLVIFKEDFDVIIKEPLLRQRKEQIDFCKSLKVFHDFPCEVFADHPSQFFFQYFRQGDVVVRCSRDTPYIVVVKTGKCKVVSDFKEKSSDRLSSAMFSTDLEHAFPLYTEMKKIEAKRPKSDTALDDKNKFKSTICAGMLTGTVDKMSLVENVQSDILTRRKKFLKKSNTLSNIFDRVETERPSQSSISDSLVHDEMNNRFTDNGLYRSENTSSADKQWNSPTSSSGFGSYYNRSAAKYRHKRPAHRSNTVSYAQISILESGSVFGLESLISRPSTTLSLISEGAECIFISKSLFLKEANIKVLRVVSDLVQSYPSHDIIKDHVHVFRDWNKYKSSLVSGIVSRNKEKQKIWVGGVPSSVCNG